MNALLKFRPDLRDCELEDRLVPVIPNMGGIVLTTGGYVLLGSIPVIAAYPSGAPGGTGIPTPLFITGSGGIASIQPGNSTRVPGLATTAPTGSNGGAAVTIVAGSGANDAGATIIPLVTRNTIANDALNAAPSIGRVVGDRSSVLPPGQVYRGGLTMTTPGAVSTEAASQLAGQDPGQGPVDPLPIRLGSRPHRLSSGASGDPARLHADRAP
jgi:hypothetical protein